MEERASGAPLITIAGWRYRTYICYYYNMAAHNNIMRSSYTLYIYTYIIVIIIYACILYGYVKRTQAVLRFMGRSEIYNINGRENKPRAPACIAKTMEVPTIVVIAFALHPSLRRRVSLHRYLFIQHIYTHACKYIHTHVIF